jgi:glycosyltransferase involved in cell wall biosynthesis
MSGARSIPREANGVDSGLPHFINAAMNDRTRYIVITPVRDEADHIERTIASVVHQTVRPHRWIVVDDGSIDGTAQVLDRHAAEHEWITVVHRGNRGFRSAGGGVMEAFLSGYDRADANWDYLVKLDGDLSFAPDYFEACFGRFEADPTLGIGGGTVCQIEGGSLRVDATGDPPFHVRGATKIYRRACWEAIGLPVVAAGWDTIDEVKANRFGWSTRTFPDLNVVQHKPTGAAAGKWADAFKNGRANYMTGYHPVFMLAKCAKRSMRRPLLLEATALLAGYCSGYLQRIPSVVDPATIRYVRDQQLRRLLLRPSIYG